MTLPPTSLPLVFCINVCDLLGVCVCVCQIHSMPCFHRLQCVRVPFLQSGNVICRNQSIKIVNTKAALQNWNMQIRTFSERRTRESRPPIEPMQLKTTSILIPISIVLFSFGIIVSGLLLNTDDDDDDGDDKDEDEGKDNNDKNEANTKKKQNKKLNWDENFNGGSFVFCLFCLFSIFGFCLLFFFFECFRISEIPN